MPHGFLSSIVLLLNYCISLVLILTTFRYYNNPSIISATEFSPLKSCIHSCIAFKNVKWNKKSKNNSSRQNVKEKVSGCRQHSSERSAAFGPAYLPEWLNLIICCNSVFLALLDRGADLLLCAKQLTFLISHCSQLLTCWGLGWEAPALLLTALLSFSESGACAWCWAGLLWHSHLLHVTVEWL